MILSLLRIQDLVPRSTWLQPIKLLPAIFLYALSINIFTNNGSKPNTYENRLDKIHQRWKYLERGLILLKKKKKKTNRHVENCVEERVCPSTKLFGNAHRSRQIFIAPKQCQVVYNRQPSSQTIFTGFS